MDIDLFSPQAVADPWPLVKQVMSQGPVVPNERTGTWMITTDKLCRQVFLNSARFTLEGAIGSRIFGPEAFITIDDRKRHDALRGIWAAAFHRRALEVMRPVIVDIADRMLDRVEAMLSDGQTIDAASELCRDLPAYVIAHMMGVPADMRPSIVKWSDEIGHAVGLPQNTAHTDPVWVQAREAKQALADYLLKQINFRRTQPGADLISQIVHSEVGRSLSDEALVANSRQLLFAGNETTAKWLGHILVVLGERPDVRRQVNEDRTLLPQALEEVMRWQPVNMSLPRLVRGGDIDVEGIVIPDGAELALLTGAAGRDPARYESPDDFDIRRPVQSHLGFGFSMHSCLGVTLARLEAEVVMGRVLDRIPNYRIAGTVKYNAFSFRGPTFLPLALA
ncbi:MAG: cytochrome P450 [Pseudomonadota bacterium]|nr:cytochrome P450 [Pseudomonadota bacterium]